MPKNKLIAFVGVGMEAVGLILGAVWLGQYADSYFDLKYVFTSILPILALTGWIVHIMFMVKNLNS